MLDRHRTAALPFAGSTLLTQHYHDVPLLSLAWGVGQIGLPFSESGAIHIFGLSLPLEADSTIVASVTPHCRWSRRSASLRSVWKRSPPPTTKPPARPPRWPRSSPWPAASPPRSRQPRQQRPPELLKTAEVTQKRNRVVVTATLPAGALPHSRACSGSGTAAFPRINQRTCTANSAWCARMKSVLRPGPPKTSCERALGHVDLPRSACPRASRRRPGRSATSTLPSLSTATLSPPRCAKVFRVAERSVGVHLAAIRNVLRLAAHVNALARMGDDESVGVEVVAESPSGNLDQQVPAGRRGPPAKTRCHPPRHTRTSSVLSHPPQTSRPAS